MKISRSYVRTRDSGFLGPLPLKRQGPGDHARTATEAPANPATDAAIGRALEYLKSTQKPDGAWEAAGSAGRPRSRRWR